ncbi:hypothetical protein [Aneurinibacillus migulanus]|uniref:hypothetical protein n=1 Tax=Aneurinibacillus migulanus TaxID=47500 RepID=UPI000698A2BC|nr:hypothetical protein [Aneurinibacillus migulanus]
MDNLFESGRNAFNKFNIDNAYVKPKHLSTSGGKSAKFLGASKSEAETILKDAMRKGNIVEVLDNGLSAQGNQTYVVIINAGEEVGTRGETLIKLVLSDDGGMLSAYPKK